MYKSFRARVKTDYCKKLRCRSPKTEEPTTKENNKQQRFVWAKDHKKWTLDQWKSVFGVISPNLRFCMVPTVKHGGGDVIGIYSKLKAY